MSQLATVPVERRLSVVAFGGLAACDISASGLYRGSVGLVRSKAG